MPLEPLSDQEQQNLVSRHSESEKGQETSSLGAKFRGESCGFLASLTAVFLHFSTTSSPSLPFSTRCCSSSSAGNARDLAVDCCHLCRLCGHADVVPWNHLRGAV